MRRTALVGRACESTNEHREGARKAIRRRRNRIVQGTTNKRTVIRVAAGTLLGVLATSLVVACTSPSGTGSAAIDQSGSGAAMATAAAPERAESGSGGAAAPVPDAADFAAGSAGSAGSSESGEQQLAGLPPAGSQVIRTAQLSVRLEVQPVPATDDAAADRDADAAARAAAVTTAAGAVRGVVATAGGFVAGADGGGSAVTITLRVPADQYDAVLDRIAGLGAVTARTESTQDVTAQIVDVNSRVASMTASVERVRALLGQATSIADVIAIESELATREADLESLQQQQAALQGQVAMSTVTVGISAVTRTVSGQTEPAPDTGFVAGLKAGWDNLLQFLTWLGALIGGLLPWLPLIAVVVGVLWWALRRLRRSRRPGAGSAVPPAAADPGAGPGRDRGPDSGPDGPDHGPDHGPDGPDQGPDRDPGPGPAGTSPRQPAGVG